MVCSAFIPAVLFSHRSHNTFQTGGGIMPHGTSPSGSLIKPQHLGTCIGMKWLQGCTSKWSHRCQPQFTKYINTRDWVEWRLTHVSKHTKIHSHLYNRDRNWSRTVLNRGDLWVPSWGSAPKDSAGLTRSCPGLLLWVLISPREINGSKDTKGKW